MKTVNELSNYSMQFVGVFASITHDTDVGVATKALIAACGFVLGKSIEGRKLLDQEKGVTQDSEKWAQLHEKANEVLKNVYELYY